MATAALQRAPLTVAVQRTIRQEFQAGQQGPGRSAPGRPGRTGCLESEELHAPGCGLAGR